MLLFVICAFSLLAGFIDSIVGGGGLIQLPAMLILSVIGKALRLQRIRL